MASQEQQGWYRLATRELDRIPVSDDSAVNDAISALKSAAPPIKLGAVGSTGIGSAEWGVAAQELQEACRAVGFEAAIEAFTGG